MTAGRIAGGVGSALGTLGNIALTWETKAAKIAGRFGMAGQLVAGFIELLIPPQDQPPPVTKQDLSKALNDLKTDVIMAIWKNTATTVLHDVSGFNDDFQDKWKDLTKIKLDTQKDAAGKAVGSRPVFDTSDELTATTAAVADTYYYPAGTSALGLDTYREDIEGHDFNDGSLNAADLAQKKTLTLQLYILIGSLQVSYYQASIAWRWGKEMLLANQVISYNKDHDNWLTQCLANPNYAATNPEADLINPYPELKAKLKLKSDFLTGYQQPDWGVWSTEAGSPVEKLQERVDSLLDYCINGVGGAPGLYTDLRKRWDALDATVTPYSQPPVGTGKQVSLTMVTAIQLAFACPKAWAQAVTVNNLQNLAADDLVAFGKALDAWRTVRASVSFHYYTTVKGEESFTSVATLQYADASLAAKIAQYNPDVKAGVNDALPVGTELKIFDKAWLPYVDLAKELWPRPAVQPQST